MKQEQYVECTAYIANKFRLWMLILFKPKKCLLVKGLHKCFNKILSCFSLLFFHFIFRILFSFKYDQNNLMLYYYYSCVIQVC